MVNRIFTHRNALYREYWKLIHLVVVTRVIAERPLVCHLIGVEVTLEHDLSTGRHLQIAANTLSNLRFTAAQ